MYRCHLSLAGEFFFVWSFAFTNIPCNIFDIALLVPSRVSMYFLSPMKIKVGEISVVIPQCSSNPVLAESTTKSSSRWYLLIFSSRLSHLLPDLRTKRNPSSTGLFQSVYSSDFNQYHRKGSSRISILTTKGQLFRRDQINLKEKT